MPSLVQLLIPNLDSVWWAVMSLVPGFMWHENQGQKGAAERGEEEQQACSSCTPQLEFNSLPSGSLSVTSLEAILSLSSSSVLVTVTLPCAGCGLGK